MIRNILAAALMLGLVACQGTQPNTLAIVATDVNSIATGLNNALAQPQVQSLIPVGQRATVNTALADLIKVSGDVAAAPSSAAQKASVAVIEADVNALVASLAGLPLPPPAPTVLQAAVVLLPIIETAVGLVVPASASQGSMSASEARLVLRGQARR